MDKSEALRSIDYDLVEYIQKQVQVDFDNFDQRPVSLRFGGKTYAVGEVLGRFRTQLDYPPNAYLMQVDKNEVYFIYFHYCNLDPLRHIHEGYWVLCFRILGDHEIMALYREERKVLLNMSLKRVVDFHGHLCPDLVLGCKLCEYARKLFPSNGGIGGNISVIAENSTSALDAIQIMLGTTMGNQRMLVMDFGKHNYTLLSPKSATGYKLSIKKQQYGEEEVYHQLERKISSNRAVIEDVVHFQKVLDGRVKRLLSLEPEDIYAVHSVQAVQPPVEMPSVFVVCGRCGEEVLETRTIDYQGGFYCSSCFQQIQTACPYNRMQ